MPRVVKIPVRPMEDMPISGGSICVICRKHLDAMDNESEYDMSGCGVIKDIEKVTKKVRKTGKKAGKYVTTVDGLASDIVNFGIPALTGLAAGTATTALTANPLLGAAGSAAGAKAGTMLADLIADKTAIQSRYDEGNEATGGAIKPKRKAKYEKGSQEAKDHMASLRAKRVKKTTE